MKQKFYCIECGSVVDNLVNYYGFLTCPICEYEIFESEEELREYLDYEPTADTVPFEKSRKARGERLGQGRVHGN